MKPNPRVVVPVVAAIVVIVIALVFLRRAGERDRLTASGTVEATEAQLGFQAPGRIDSLLVDEGDAVRAGQPLASLDRTEARARRDQAAAQLEAARALMLELEHGSRREEIAQARAVRDAAAQRLEDARRDLARAQDLVRDSLVSTQVFEKAGIAFDVATSQLEQADEQYRLVATGARKERIAAQRAQVALSRAALDGADAVLANMVVRAPFDGVVTVRHRQLGEIVQAGAAVLSVMNRLDRWVRIYVSETRIGAVHLGQQAGITSDTFPGKSYPGEVQYISGEAEFTPKNVQTREERVKLVYAVKVRISGDPGFELKPGMPADVRLATEQR
jgi:HlyD family secretion protein